MFIALDHVSGMVVGPFNTFTEVLGFVDSAVERLDDEDESPFEILNIDSVEDWVVANTTPQQTTKEEVDA